MISKFDFKHFDKFEPRQDSETLYNFNMFLANPAYKKFLQQNAHMYTIFYTIPSTKKEVILAIIGGYRTAPGTAEMLLCPSRYFDRNVLQCMKILRKVLGEDRDKYFPSDVYRLEMNCNLSYPDTIKFGTKGMKFDVVGIRHKFGAEKQEDYLLLERIL